MSTESKDGANLPDETLENETEQIVVNMGPQHPSTHGVFRMILTLTGETILKAELVMGYLHRGVEKQCSDMVSSHVIGAFREDRATRAEFMNLLSKNRRE